MSEKKAKQLRKEEQARKEEGEKPLFQTMITVFKNGNIQVQGFPSSVKMAMKLASDFNEAMTMYFIEAARAGKLDLQGKIIKSPIIGPKSPRPPIVMSSLAFGEGSPPSDKLVKKELPVKKGGNGQKDEDSQRGLGSRMLFSDD